MAVDHNIPDSLNVLRKVLENEGGDYTIAVYDSPHYNTNFVNPLFCLCPKDSFGVDIAAVIEESIEVMLNYGFTEDELREIMGLMDYEDVVEQGEPDDPTPAMNDEYMTVGDKWYLPADIENFEAIAPEDCDAVLADVATSAQVRQVRDSLEKHEIGIAASMLLLSEKFNDAQAFAICKAFREGVDEASARAIADPRFKDRQMRELAQIALLCPAAENGELATDFVKCLNPDFKPGKLYQLRALGKALGGEKGFGWQGIEAWKYSEAQLCELNYALVKNMPVDKLQEYFPPSVDDKKMAVLTCALSDGLDANAMRRIADDKLSAERANCVYQYIKGQMAGSISRDQLDMLCDFVGDEQIGNLFQRDDVHVSAADAIYYGFTADQTPMQAAKRLANGSLAPRQMIVAFDALHDFDVAGMSDGEIEKNMAFLADPALKPAQMARLKSQIENGVPIEDLRGMKDSFIAKGNRPTAGREERRSLDNQARAARGRSARRAERHGERKENAVERKANSQDLE